MSERPEQPPLPPPPPGPPPGWRISPRAVDTDPNAPPAPPPGAERSNVIAFVALGLSATGFASLWFGVAFVIGIPLGIAGAILGYIARGRVKRGETRQGVAVVDVALWTGVAASVLCTGVLVVVLARGTWP